MHNGVRPLRRSTFKAPVNIGRVPPTATTGWIAQGAPMVRYAGAPADPPVWVEVSLVQPCPICGGTSRCAVHEDGEFARCLEIICDWPLVTGGWLHRLEGRDVEATLTS